MMKQTVSIETTRKIASLGKLNLPEGELEKYSQDLTRILDFIEQLNEVDTSGVEPMIHGFPLEASFREDVAVKLSEEDAKSFLACAEQSLYDQYKVPQVLGGES